MGRPPRIDTAYGQSHPQHTRSTTSRSTRQTMPRNQTHGNLYPAPMPTVSLQPPAWGHTSGLTVFGPNAQRPNGAGAGNVSYMAAPQSASALGATANTTTLGTGVAPGYAGQQLFGVQNPRQPVAGFGFGGAMQTPVFGLAGGAMRGGGNGFGTMQQQPQWGGNPFGQGAQHANTFTTGTQQGQWGAGNRSMQMPALGETAFNGAAGLSNVATAPIGWANNNNSWARGMPAYGNGIGLAGLGNMLVQQQNLGLPTPAMPLQPRTFNPFGPTTYQQPVGAFFNNGAAPPPQPLFNWTRPAMPYPYNYNNPTGSYGLNDYWAPMYYAPSGAPMQGSGLFTGASLASGLAGNAMFAQVLDRRMKMMEERCQLLGVPMAQELEAYVDDPWLNPYVLRPAEEEERGEQREREEEEEGGRDEQQGQGESQRVWGRTAQGVQWIPGIHQDAALPASEHAQPHQAVESYGRPSMAEQVDVEEFVHAERAWHMAMRQHDGKSDEGLYRTQAPSSGRLKTVCIRYATAY